MRILVVGKGGREHALSWRLGQCPSVTEVFCTIGNPGISAVATPVPIAPNELGRLAKFASEARIDLTVVGPEEPLALGIADEFEARGLLLLGPSRAAAQLESSKAFAKQVMAQAGVPTASFAVFDDPAAARSYVRERGGQLVVKADGLAAGKGVTVCEEPAAAIAAIDQAMERGAFGSAGRRVVIEEKLSGQEVSFFALCDGTRAAALGMAQDYKQILDGDRGPNTGGMGAYSPLPQFDAALETRIMDQIVLPTLDAMASRDKPFRGVLFAGLMVDREHGPRVLEFNVRMGDPECEALMMRVEGDLAQGLLDAARGRLCAGQIRLAPKSAVAVVLASAGYPGDYRKGLQITGLEQVAGVRTSEGAMAEVFHAGTTLSQGRLVTDGGRVLVITAAASTLAAARDDAYLVADLIDFPGKQMRRDIAARAVRSAP